MEHTIKAFDSAYPGSMFEKPRGSYVERDDAKSLAAALLEIIATEKRSASDLLDELQESRDEFHALKAQRDELLAGLERIANPIPYEQANVPEGYTLDGHALLAQVSKPLYYQTVARALIAKHKEASHG